MIIQIKFDQSGHMLSLEAWYDSSTDSVDTMHKRFDGESLMNLPTGHFISTRKSFIKTSFAHQ